MKKKPLFQVEGQMSKVRLSPEYAPVKQSTPNCSSCQFYHALDSGYGTCFGLPASYRERPLVAWCDPPCSLHVSRSDTPYNRSINQKDILKDVLQAIDDAEQG